MAIVNITTYNDADFYRLFLYQHQDLTPVDLTGVSFAMEFRRHAFDATVYLALSSDPGGGIGVATDPTDGTFTILITKEQLQLELIPGEYEQSLIMTRNGIRERVWSGTLTNNWGPTR